MEEQQMTDLGPKPEPQIEPGEPNPGGVDAIDGGDHHDLKPEIPNLPTEKNPAVDDVATEDVKDQMKDSEDTSTRATEDGEEVPPEDESPA
ncbi:hypothetical protein NLS1_35060 [Nocardioides sp. LS1]|nr:hypothetical protein NLS1_35060 [Nocardioides sp. LS1]